MLFQPKPTNTLVINRLISAVEKLTKGVNRIMNNTNGNLLSAIQTGNAAHVAIALWESGVDITTPQINRIFSNIPFAACAKIVKTFPMSSKADIKAAMEFEAQCTDVFSASYQQAIDSGMQKKEASPFAQNAVAEYRATHANGSPAVKVESKLPAQTASGIKPFDASAKKSPAKIHEIAKGLVVKFGGVAYKVTAEQSGGVWRITLLNETSIHKIAAEMIGSVIELTDQTGQISYGNYTVVKVGGKWANLAPVSYKAVATPTPAQSPTPTQQAAPADDITAKILQALMNPAIIGAIVTAVNS